MIAALPDDEWSEYVGSGEAFTVEAIQVAAAGMFPHVQLFNPAASGIRVRLRCFEPMTAFGIGLNQNIRRHDVALTALNTFGVTENLLGGGPANGAEVRTDSLPALVGSPFWLFLTAANGRNDYPPEHLDWGHDLLPGQGVLLGGTVGSFMITGIQWAEVPL